jgi:hypothetical protein
LGEMVDPDQVIQAAIALVSGDWDKIKILVKKY